MKKLRVAPIVAVLALPALAAALGLFARAEWETRWSTGLRREFVAHGQRANARVMARYSLASLCADPRNARRIPPCRAYNGFSTTIVFAGGVAGFGLLLLGGIYAAGASGRRSRRALVAGFRPVVYGVTAAIVLLLIAHALLGLQAARVLALVAGVQPATLLVFLGGAGVAVVFGAAAAAVRIARGAAGPRRLLAVGLDDRVSAAWVGDGAQPVVAGLVPEVFVASRGCVTLDGPLPSGAVHVPLTLARILTGPELRALVARARFRTGEQRAAAAAAETWTGVTAEYAATRRAGGVQFAIALPVLPVLALLLDVYDDAQAALERQLQLEADRAAADACGAKVCGVAILKAAAFAPAWAAAVREMREALRAAAQYPNAAALYEDIVAANRDPARFAAVTHPDAATPGPAVPLRQRLERLGLVPDDLAADALAVPPGEPAIRLAPIDLAPLEERLTAIVHAQLLP